MGVTLNDMMGGGQPEVVLMCQYLVSFPRLVSTKDLRGHSYYSTPVTSVRRTVA